MKIEGNNVVSGEKPAGFQMAKAYKMVDAMWTEKGFSRAETRADFVAKLDAAIGEFDGSVKL